MPGLGRRITIMEMLARFFIARAPFKMTTTGNPSLRVGPSALRQDDKLGRNPSRQEDTVAALSFGGQLRNAGRSAAAGNIGGGNRILSSIDSVPLYRGAPMSRSSAALAMRWVPSAAAKRRVRGQAESLSQGNARGALHCAHFVQGESFAPSSPRDNGAHRRLGSL